VRQSYILHCREARLIWILFVKVKANINNPVYVVSSYSNLDEYTFTYLSSYRA
jgi:hypothetical protein